MPEPLLSVTNLKKHFAVKNGFHTALIKAVDGVSFNVAGGEVFGIVGESGSGKSTIANCLVRLCEPTSGEIAFRGHPVDKLSAGELRRLRRDISLVFQDPFSSLNPRKTVGWLLDETLTLNTGMSRDECYNEIGLTLSAVGLKPVHRERYPSELSGGQRQRVALALALILRPKLVIADEPLSSLDVSIRKQILALMGELKKERGLSYIFISHDLNTVRHICDKVAVMYKGRFAELGPAAAVFDKRLHPYTRLLLDATPTLDKKLAAPVLAEALPALSGSLTESAPGHFVDLG